jgi:hypothetical protein
MDSSGVGRVSRVRVFRITSSQGATTELSIHYRGSTHQTSIMSQQQLSAKRQQGILHQNRPNLAVSNISQSSKSNIRTTRTRSKPSLRRSVTSSKKQRSTSKWSAHFLVSVCHRFFVMLSSRLFIWEDDDPFLHRYDGRLEHGFGIIRYR